LRPLVDLPDFHTQVATREALIRVCAFIGHRGHPGGALEMPSNGDVLMMLLLTALAGKQPQNALEIQFFSTPVD
jgi:hypothetical protein